MILLDLFDLLVERFVDWIHGCELIDRPLGEQMLQFWPDAAKRLKRKV